MSSTLKWNYDKPSDGGRYCMLATAIRNDEVIAIATKDFKNGDYFEVKYAPKFRLIEFRAKQIGDVRAIVNALDWLDFGMNAGK